MGHVALQRRLLATSTCLVAVAAACFPTLPPTPAELAAYPAWEMQRSGSVMSPPYEWHFGPYLLRGMERGGVEDASALLDGLRGRTHLQQRFEFRLLDDAGERELDVRCVINDRRTRVILVSDETRRLDCTIRPVADAGGVATLQLVRRNAAAPAGYLSHEETKYSIDAELIQARDVVSYYVRLDDRLVAGTRFGRALTTLEHVLGPEPERAAGHVRVVQDVSAGDRLVLAAAGLALLYNRSLIDP